MALSRQAVYIGKYLPLSRVSDYPLMNSSLFKTYCLVWNGQLSVALDMPTGTRIGWHPIGVRLKNVTAERVAYAATLVSYIVVYVSSLTALV